jgi:hypothetical protein
MKHLIERLRLLFNNQASSTGEQTDFNFVKARKAIKKELMQSKETGKAIGIYCPAIGEGMFLTCVEDISTVDGEETVSLKPYDMQGILLQRNQLSLSEIKSVCLMNCLYKNPLFRELVH